MPLYVHLTSLLESHAFSYQLPCYIYSIPYYPAFTISYFIYRLSACKRTGQPSTTNTVHALHHYIGFILCPALSIQQHRYSAQSLAQRQIMATLLLPLATHLNAPLPQLHTNDGRLPYFSGLYWHHYRKYPCNCQRAH